MHVIAVKIFSLPAASRARDGYHLARRQSFCNAFDSKRFLTGETQSLCTLAFDIPQR